MTHLSLAASVSQAAADTFLNACCTGDLATTRGLLATYGRAIVCATAGGNSADTGLHHAAEWGQVDMVAWLLEVGARDVLEEHGNLSAPLVRAAWHGHIDVMACLVAHGANLEVCGFNGTPLLAAIANERTEAALWLIEQGASVLPLSRENQAKLTQNLPLPIDRALASESAPVFAALVARGALAASGQTPLLYAACTHFGSAKLVRECLINPVLGAPYALDVLQGFLRPGVSADVQAEIRMGIARVLSDRTADVLCEALPEPSEEGAPLRPAKGYCL